MLPRNIRGEFRIDAFNVFNIPHFNNPNGTLGNANFGQITERARFQRAPAAVWIPDYVLGHRLTSIRHR